MIVGSKCEKQSSMMLMVESSGGVTITIFQVFFMFENCYNKMLKNAA